ncbi:MAG: hypothetical protein PHQ43_04320 [Dehalococcoidales bacterium]|nr:hypothetical protein [Dehalococcoidales bacterium]
MEPKELFGNDYSVFTEVDPFNSKNTVEGFISRKPNQFYGAMIITKVNGEKVPEQLVMGTPKIGYPFTPREDGTRNYFFPSARDIEMYEKKDGTNIVSYQYVDASGWQYLSFKTRLRPFVTNGRFGPFFDMWNEIAGDKFGSIKQVMQSNGCNLSFELWGSRNVHLIVYDVPLAFSLLFGVTNTGTIKSLSDLKADALPLVPMLKKIDRDYVWNYEQTQKELQAGLKQEEEYYRGQEGSVWYMHLPDGRCLLYKLKPETIEAIHWAAGGGGLSRNSIISTCWNAFENVDKLSYEFVSQLLLEEFEQHAIDLNKDLIERCIVFVSGEAEFRKKVLEAYRATGMNVLLNKREVMRVLSERFPRNQMKKVYSTIVRYA